MPASQLDALIVELKGLIDGGDVEDAFERLLNYLPTNSSKLNNEALAQSSRYRTARRRQLAGRITVEQFYVEENNIRNWLLDFIERLPARVERRFSPVIPAARHISGGAAQIDNGNIAKEKILGINNLKQVWWIERGVQVCKSVCRILTPQGLGTGFLVGPKTIMTNNHVVGTRELAAVSFAEFNYQADLSNQLMPAFRYRMNPDRFHTNAGLDYSFIGLEEEQGKPPMKSWGCLQLNPNADPIPTEHVSIVQHPNGGLKQIVLTANQVVATKPPFLHYTTDTMPGSSGSPVFNDTWHVIAIHHFAVTSRDTEQGYANEGVLMSAIKADASPLWPAGA